MNSQLAQSLKFFGLLGVLARPVIVATILFDLWRALTLARINQRFRKVFWWATAILVTGWLVTVWTLAARGTFESFSTVSPAFAAAIVVATLIFPVAVALIVGGFLILIIERVRPRPQILDVDQMKMRTALGIGCCQILAMIPGVSRAGATIMGAMMLRVDRAAATQFSFFLAVPTMLGATVYDLYKNRAILTVEGSELIAIGFVVAFLCALFVVRTLVGFVSRHGFGVFAWYRIAIGTVALLLLTMTR